MVVLAVGAVVRLVAPLLGAKDEDPAIVCLDDAGRHAVVLLGAHRGANALAEEVAGLLGAEAVVTTASDTTGRPALDQLPGFAAEGDLAKVTAAFLDGAPLEVLDEAGWPLPSALAERAGTPGAPRARLVVTDRAPAPGAGPPTVWLHPASLVVGAGSSSDAKEADLVEHVASVLAGEGLSVASVGAVATVKRRGTHPALVGLAGRLGVPLVAFSPKELASVAVPNPSPEVEAAVGTPSVAEAAALLAAGPGATLVVAKRREPTTTVAVARRSGPEGRLSVVGLGPGHAAHRTPAAAAAVRHAEVVVGYTAYLDLCADLLSPAQEVLGFPLGAEQERAEAALAQARAGRRVALVSSGDPGVYAMASPLLELAEAQAPALAIHVVPGVTAGSAAAAVLGAPLGHDHAVVSLSDLHTPFEIIERRVAAAASGDLVVVLYNPRSARRDWQLERARGILLAWRAPSTPVGVVRQAARPDQAVTLTTLGALETSAVDMASIVIVGSSTTRVVGGLMVTPRGYRWP